MCQLRVVRADWESTIKLSMCPGELYPQACQLPLQLGHQLQVLIGFALHTTNILSSTQTTLSATQKQRSEHRSDTKTTLSALQQHENNAEAAHSGR